MAITERYVTQAAGGGGDGSEGTPWTFAEAVANYAAGDRVNVKSDGTYAFSSSTQTLATSATDAAPVHWRGYTTDIGDGGKAVITLTSSQILLTGAGIVFDAFNISGSTTTRHVNSSGENTLVNLDVENTGNGYCIDGSPGDVILACSAALKNATSASRFAITIEAGIVAYCAIKSAQRGVAVNTTPRDAYLINNLIVGESTGTIGIDQGTLANSTGNKLFAIANSIYDYGDGIHFDEGPDIGDTTGLCVCINNVIWSVTNGIINVGGTNESRMVLVSNFIGSAATARYSGMGDAIIINDVTLTADPFTAKGSDDFSLNNTAGGGALIRDAGLQVPTLL